MAAVELSTTPYLDDTPSDDGQLDDDGHGTNVAGIVLGMAPGAGIAALDVFHTDGYAYSDDIIDGINWSIANRDTYNIVGINMSLGGSIKYTSACDGDGYWNSAYLAAAATAKSAGIVTVAAAGNEGYTDGIASPACISDIVSVGAVFDDTYPAYADDVAPFSNSATFLDFLAPGRWITAAGWTMSGTSQAAPHIAGAVAVMAGAYPYETPEQLVSRLKAFGVAVTDSRNGITKPRLDLAASYGAGFASLICSGDDKSLEKLTVPAGATADCLTNNSITAGTAVTVESGGSLTLQSAIVTLAPGFHAEGGSLLYVNP